MADKHLIPSRERVELERRRRRPYRWVPVLTFPLVILYLGGGSIFAASAAGIAGFLLYQWLLLLPPERMSGMAGEEAVAGLLDWLPEYYALFNQVHVPNPRSRTGTTEIDAVVVGPTGVFVVEVKNNNGTVLGGPEGAPKWVVQKVGRGGTPYTATMRNPVRQAKGQAMALRDWLLIQGIQVWVRPVVVLAHREVQWRPGQEYSVPVVVRSPGRILAILQSGHPRPALRGDPERIKEALSRLRSEV